MQPSFNCCWLARHWLLVRYTLEAACPSRLRRIRNPVQLYRVCGDQRRPCHLYVTTVSSALVLIDTASASHDSRHDVLIHALLQNIHTHTQRPNVAGRRRNKKSHGGRCLYGSMQSRALSDSRHLCVLGREPGRLGTRNLDAGGRRQRQGAGALDSLAASHTPRQVRPRVARLLLGSAGGTRRREQNAHMYVHDTLLMCRAKS